MILLGEKHVRFVVEEYAERYYNHEKPHQGLGNRTITPLAPMPTEGSIRCRQRLGGLLKSYYRKAA
jgi:putative transposase